MEQQLIVLIITLLCGTAFIHGAHQRPPNDCPSPCTCRPFQGVKWTYCNATGITEVPKGIPVDTQVLELSYNPIKHIAKDALQGLVNLEEVSIEGNGYVEGDIEEGVFDLPKLTTISLGSNKFTTIPKCLPKQLTRFYFWYNSLETITSGSFFSCPNLQYFDFSNNHISTIEEHAFDILSNIDTMYFLFNNISENSLPKNAFVKNTKLQMASFRFNKFQKLYTAFPPSVRYIDFVGNQIQTLPSFAFKSLPNIESMAFWQGQVTSIEDNAFFGLLKLTSLDFMQDQISSRITNLTFNGLASLDTIYMDLNSISQIDAGAFHVTPSIKSLWLSDNKLHTLVPEVLDTKYIPKLSEVYIDGNPWFCDCHLRWLREKVDNATYVIQDPHLITCAGPAKVAGKAWDVLKPSDFVCN